MQLKDKIAVIAGDAYGVGRASAELFTREGATVLLIDDLAGTAGAKAVKAGAFDVPFIYADVTDSAQVQAAARECAARFERVDILFNIAGRTPIRQSFEHTTEETWAAMIARNLSSGFLCVKYLLPLLKRTKAGSVINHASIDAILGNPGIAAYSAAKGGVLPLTHVMAHDLAKYNIRVNAISTGGIRSSAAPMNPAEQARIAVTPAARMGTAEDVAHVALFLASDASAYINGANIVCDGGRTATTHGCYRDSELLE